MVLTPLGCWAKSRSGRSKALLSQGMAASAHRESLSKLLPALTALKGSAKPLSTSPETFSILILERKSLGSMSSRPQDAQSQLPSLISAICQRPHTSSSFRHQFTPVYSARDLWSRPFPPRFFSSVTDHLCRIHLKDKSDDVPWIVEPDELLRKVDPR